MANDPSFRKKAFSSLWIINFGRRYTSIVIHFILACQRKFLNVRKDFHWNLTKTESGKKTKWNLTNNLLTRQTINKPCNTAFYLTVFVVWCYNLNFATKLCTGTLFVCFNKFQIDIYNSYNLFSITAKSTTF